MPLCQDLEAKMIKLVWRHRHIVTAPNTPIGSTMDGSELASTATSNVNLAESAAIEQIPITDKERPDSQPTKSLWRWGWRSTPKTDESNVSDPEKDGPAKSEPRPIRLYAPFYCGLAVALSICRPLCALLLISVLTFHTFSLHRQWTCCLARRVDFRR